MNKVGVFFKAIFMISGLVVLPWGLVEDSLAKTLGGLGLLLLALITNGED